MSENWYVVHTQPRGEKMLKALLDREPAVTDTYLPMRQQFAIVGGQRVSRMALTMPGLVFVRGNKNQLVALLREKSGASRLMVDSSRKEKDAMVVADSEMTAFRLFNDNTAGQLMMLRSPFCNFTSADRIRIMSGPFAGYEGYIREIGGDNKLIFKVGSMAIFPNFVWCPQKNTYSSGSPELKRSLTVCIECSINSNLIFFNRSEIEPFYICVL